MSYSVAILEDDKWIIRGIEQSFDWDKYGFYVTATFLDPYSLLEYIEKNKVDVIFTDIKMPQMTGLELISKIKNEMGMKDIYFVIISAYDSYEYMRKAINLGVIDYCKKPIDRSETDSVLEKLKTVLDASMSREHEVTVGNKAFQNLIWYIENHYSEKLTLKDLSKKFYFNSNYLCLLFKKHLNTTFSSFLTKIRMEKARELLLTGNYSVSEVVSMVGFNDYSYFNRVFTSYYNRTPSAFLHDNTGPKEDGTQ